jgi:hypothetical protein
MLTELTVTKGTNLKPAGIILYARSGLGKTTMLGDWVKNSSNGLLFQCGEDGLSDLDPSWTKDVPYYAEILGNGSTSDELADGWTHFKEDILKFLMVGKHDFKHVGFDNFDNLINNNLDAYVVKEYYKGNLKEANAWGGAKLKEMYSELALIIKAFEYLQNKKGISICLTFHAQPMNFRDPSIPDYKKWSIAIPTREDYNLRTQLINWSSVTMFGTLDIDVENKKASGNNRVLKTTEDASWEAKCRYKIPETIEFSYQSYQKEINKLRKDQ